MKKYIDKLYKENYLNSNELLDLLNNMSEEDKIYLFEKANATKMKHYEDKIFVRGLLEFTNYCKRNCVYCGIRSSNKNADRYRLSPEEIIKCCDRGNELGYKTFVLQGGEDDFYTDEKIVKIISKIKNKFPSCAVTLSIGERSYESYKKYYDAGADRYLLRHETASEGNYKKFHPKMKFEDRKKCLIDLKKIGYQVGAGFVVGLPGECNEDYVEDLLFLKKIEPHMVGIGPFIPHKDTPFSKEKEGTAETTIIMVAITRLLLPDVLLPATTALGIIDLFGREKALKSGANVIMPNLSPARIRGKYSIYDGKGDIETKVNKEGLLLDMSRGDNKLWRI